MQNGTDNIKSNGAKRKCSEMGFGGQDRCEHDVQRREGIMNHTTAGLDELVKYESVKWCKIKVNNFTK